MQQLITGLLLAASVWLIHLNVWGCTDLQTLNLQLSYFNSLYTEWQRLYFNMKHVADFLISKYIVVFFTGFINSAPL